MAGKWISAAVALAAFAMPACAAAQEHEPDRPYTGPVIDVHLHAAGAEDNGPAPNAVCPGISADLRYTGEEPWPVFLTGLVLDPACESPIEGPATDAEVMLGTIEQVERHEVTAILSSSSEGFATWSAAAPGRFLRGMQLNVRRDAPISAEEVAAAYDAGEFAVLSEVTNQYDGVLVDDPEFAPFLAIAAERGIPVGVHIGPGPPGSPALHPDYRIQSPLRLEEVMRAHPGLRLYVMHAGYPFIDDMKALLYYYPQVYVGVGVLQLAVPRAEYYAYLEELVRAGFIDRIMFGSDQMNWPGMIEEGIAAINDAPFLGYAQKRAILHDNAARFFAPELESFRAAE